MISFSEELSLGRGWSGEGANITNFNKYIFTEDVLEGKIVYFSEVPFFMGFKVDDLILMSTNKYCFIAPPGDIESKARLFNNVNITTSIDLCSDEEKNVCFGAFFTGCDITVISSDNYETGDQILENAQSRILNSYFLYQQLVFNCLNLSKGYNLNKYLGSSIDWPFEKCLAIIYSPGGFHEVCSGDISPKRFLSHNPFLFA